jgi:hypothetical protein
MTQRERQLKYSWERTWADRETDYVAKDGEIRFGRVQLHTTGPEKVWTWHLWGDAFADFSVQSLNGSHPDKIEACRELEAAYDAAKAKATRA